MTRLPVPIADLGRRVPEAGRLRIGEKTTKGAPRAIGTWRFTSHDATALDQIARLYGGTVRPWGDPKAAAGQSEVVTDATEIRVVLPPNPLGDGPMYELWGGGGCERRCNGVTATVMQRGPEGPEPTDVPCLCLAKGAMQCAVTTRMSVILPEVRFAGVWRLDTKSWNAAQELPGMVDMIHQAQGEGLQYALLSIKPRQSVSGGQTRKFMVPVLGLSASVEQLAAGGTRLSALPTADLEAPAIPASVDLDDEIVDAELVDDGPSAARPAPVQVIAKADADLLTERMKNADDPTEAKKAWKDRFGVWPSALPIDQLDAALDFTSDLEVPA